MGNIHKEVRFGSSFPATPFGWKGRRRTSRCSTILLSAIFRDIISLFGKSIPLIGSIYLSIDSLATTTGQDRRSPNLPISLSEATITEGSLPTGDFFPAPTSDCWKSSPTKERCSRENKSHCFPFCEGARQRDIGVVAHISSREGWLIQKGTHLYLAGLEKQEKRTAEMVDYFPLTPFFFLSHCHRDEWDEGRPACPTSRPE